MCGIAGIIGDISPDICSTSLTMMVLAQSHRGPDDQGIYTLKTTRGMMGLGHRRLSILDLSAHGHQPMINPDTGDVIIYNGEIYNFKELRRELESRGLRFRSGSDTEVILRAYEVWGRDCLERFRGMFAFALWDKAAERLLLARDHLGIKPLYYASTPDVPFIFASEVKALTATQLLQFKIDRRALAGYLAYGSVQSPLTLLQNVRSLERASWMEVDASGEVKTRRPYWRMPATHESASLDGRNLDEEARRILSTSVARHLVSDVPVGVFLSSGLDSTSVAGLVSEMSNATAKSFTVSFAEVPEHNEGAIARQTARRFGLEHCDCPVSSETALDWVRKALAVMDQPSMDGLNTYIVSRAVREQNMVVALSGQGGDEMFGGYPSFQEVPELYRLLNWLRYVPADIRVALARIATYPRNEAYRRKADDIARSGSNLLDLYFHRRRACSDSQMAHLGFRANELALTRNFQVPEADGSDCLVAGDPIASVGRLETKYYLGNTLLRDGDVFGMANSLEIRVPMLDRDLVDWVFSLPGETLLPPGKPAKYLLRQACSDLHPSAVASQRKRGFVVPVAHWMAGTLREVMAVGIEHVKQSGLVEHDGVDALLGDFNRNPESPIWSRVWSLVILGHWLKRADDESSTVIDVINPHAAADMSSSVA
jgi:asparagine synthase (glutamine-hydrolysing)